MFSIYRKIGWFFKQEKKRYITFFFLAVVLAYVETLPPKMLGEALDVIAQGTMTKEMLISTVLIMFFIAVFIYFATRMRASRMMYGNFRLQYLLRNQLMSYWASQDAHYYADHETGDLMAVATADNNNICMAASRVLLQLFSSTFTFSFVLIQMVTSVNLKLTLMVAIPLPIAIGIIFFMSKTVRTLFVEARDAFGLFNNSTLESVAGVSVIRAFVQEENDIQKLRNSANYAKSKELKAIKLDAAFGPLFRTVYSISTIIAMAMGVYMVFQNEITAGDLVTFNIYITMLRMPLWSAGMVLNTLQRANAAYDRFERTTTVDLKIEHGPNMKCVDTIESIKLENYSFTYPYSEFTSLKNINLEIKKGQTVGIVGKTGCGKSTLLLQLLRFYEKGEGTYQINGQGVETLDYMNLRSFFGYVPQEHVLFSKTVRENIELGAIGEVSHEKLMEAIVLADFEKDLKYLRDGLDTLCGEDGTMLSGGQKQRLSIARAFLSSPEVLLLDDSLSAVDGSTEATIVSNLKKSRQNKTTIIVAHRLSAVRHADMIVVMEDGRIVDTGTHEELLEKRGWYYEQYQNQILNQEEVKHETH